MRMFVIFLLVLNGLLFGAQYLFSAQAVVVSDDSMSSVKLIQLKHERVITAPESLPVPVNVSAVTKSQYVCRTAGPFTETEQIEKLKHELQAKVRKISIRVINESEPYRYWLYQRVKNNDEAQELTRRLAEQQVSDYYIMGAGIMGAGIMGAGDGKRVSLGRYKEKSYADKRLQQLKAQGFEVESEIIYSHYAHHWLDYELAEAQLEKIEEILSPYMQDEVKQLTRECKFSG